MLQEQDQEVEAAARGRAAPLSLGLLGGLTIRGAQGRSLALPTAKSALLLAYLATLPGQTHRRSRLAGLFWPDRGEEQARGSLRHALSRIRAVGGVIAVEGDMLALAPVDTDIRRLEAAAAGAAVTVEDALDLARPFLDGIDAAEGEVRDWLECERTRCCTLAQQVLSRLAQERMAAGEGVQALMLASRLLALDPYREQSHRLVMSLHAAGGDRSLALAHYRSCCELLRSELGVAPSAQTEALTRQIAQAERPVQAGAAAPRGGAAAPQASAAAPRDGAVAPAAEPAPSPPRDFRFSIAVVPVLDGDKDQGFLAEGLAEDVVTALSRHRDFLIIPGQARFGAAEAASALGVRFVLTAAVRAGAGRVSLCLRLMDESAGRSFWAIRRESALADLAAGQDVLMAELVERLDAEIRLAECEKALRKPPASLDAWDLFHRGLWHAHHFQAEEILRAEECFRRAIALAPDFALPHAGLAFAGLVRIGFLLTPDAGATARAALVQARAGFERDAGSPFVLTVLGRLMGYAGQMRQAFDLLRLARETHPSYAHVHYGLAVLHLMEGAPVLALDAVEVACRLSPRDPLAPQFAAIRAASLFFAGRLPEAEAELRQLVQAASRSPLAHLVLVILLVETGRREEARAAADRLAALTDGVAHGQLPVLIRWVLPWAGARTGAALRQVGWQVADL